MDDYLTTSQMGRMLGVPEWKVRRLFETGDLPAPPKFGGKRALHRNSLPKIIDALRDRGWLPDEKEQATT